jgi:hypothetical protein
MSALPIPNPFAWNSQTRTLWYVGEDKHEGHDSDRKSQGRDEFRDERLPRMNDDKLPGRS